MMQDERREDQHEVKRLYKAHSICIVYELEMIGGQLQCDNLETVDLQYFDLDEMPELFCKQHEEIKNDLQKLRNEAEH